MNTIVVLDSGPLGLATHPGSSRKSSPIALACARWLQSHLSTETTVVLPEIVDYETRREFKRAGLSRSLQRLDILKARVEYLPINTEAMLLASDLWADARRGGYPTAPVGALDADVILAAQVLTYTAHQVVVATTNVGHLERFVHAALWSDIPPSD